MLRQSGEKQQTYEFVLIEIWFQKNGNRFEGQLEGEVQTNLAKPVAVFWDLD